MYIANETFIVEATESARFETWIQNQISLIEKGEGSIRMTLPGVNLTTLRLARVVDIPGDPEFSQHAASYSLQVECTDRNIANDWLNDVMKHLIDDFTTMFPQTAMAFPSIMQILH